MKNTIFTLIFAVAANMMSLSAKAQGMADFTTAAEHSIHSVVHIKCTHSVQTPVMLDFFGIPLQFFQPMQRDYKTSGSGVVMSADGYIITNNHVVADADSITVVLNDRRSFSATLIGNDPSADLAVIKIEAKDLEAISFGNSDSVRIGEWVLAVGNPFNLTSTVTAGIVSAKARNLNILGNKMSANPIESFIQTDAAVNPGNSGGALVNLKGELIGINTAIASSTGSYAGYSFAIPSNIVKKVTNDIVKYGITQKAYIGLQLAEMDADFAMNKGLKDVHGVYVADVFVGGAAEKAGIKQGDILTKINGKSVNTNAEFNEVLAQMSPNQQTTVEYERNGRIFTQDITLLNSMGTTEISKANKDVVKAAGVTFRPLTNEERQRYKISKGIGMVVTDVGKSAFARVGIENGYIVTAIDRQDATMDDIRNLNNRKNEQVVIGGFYADGQQAYYVLIL